MPYGVAFPYTEGAVPFAQAPRTPDPFEDYSELKKICTCESGLTHFKSDGETVLRGVINRHDIGICQINEYYHQKRIDALGLNIYKYEDNISFAKDLYNRLGSAPWIWSKSCWGDK